MAVPGWVEGLVNNNGGRDLWFIMTKSLSSSDLDLRDENRLLIASQYVRDNLIPGLSEAEKTAANLLQPPAKRNTPGTGRVQGRVHGEQEVWVYPRSGFRCRLTLIRWDSGSTVIKGPKYKYFLDLSRLQENDEVELWGFRQGEEGKLCFALGRRQ